MLIVVRHGRTEANASGLLLGRRLDPALDELGRGLFNVVLELVGAGACRSGYRRFRLAEPDRRTLFLQTGRVGRDIAP